MELDQITGQELIKYLPHRGRNLLLDSVDRSETDKGPQAEISLHITPSDEKGRGIFLEKNASDETVYSPYMFAEFLALGSIVLLTDMPEGSMAYFSTITNYERSSHVSASGSLKGKTIRHKDRGLFKRFSGKILNSLGDEAAVTDIMAAAFTPEMQEEASREEKKLSEVPKLADKKELDPAAFNWKPKEMVFVQSIGSVDLEAGTGICHYIYPQDHPFCEGHFPGNPIMMGITQWEGCADAMTALAAEYIQAGHPSVKGKETFYVTANVEAIKQNGTVACEVKNIQLKITHCSNGLVPYAEVVKTRRVGFRDMVRPNDNLFFKITDFQIQS